MNFPDFSQKGYQIIEEIGHNHAGGRVTYLASKNSEEKVVIKEFQFAKNPGNSWNEYDAYQREITVLQGLNHPGIPRYLDSFETDRGFCLVQEYKNAQSLSVEKAWAAKDIKKIAIALLEILAYLQNRIPPVFHRDIKPENILVDGELNVYLVDFGFAHIGQGEVAMSSMVKGTLGFMPPEQLFNQELTLGSDLYGVGATLICLLTKTKSVDIGNLIDAYYRINFKSKIRRINPDLINWLEKMVEPKPKDRFPDANTALETLKPLEVRQSPKVNCSAQIIEVTASEFSEQLNSQIVIQNPIRGTMLTGRLQIAPHPNDPKVKPPGHGWIYISPRHFKANQIECKITISTKKLQADSTYEREILLITNASNQPYRIPLRVNTASLPKQSQLPYGNIATLFGLSFLLCCRTLFVFCGYTIFSLVFISSGFLLLLIMLGWGMAVQRLSAEKQATQIGAFAGIVMAAIMAAAIALVTGNLVSDKLNQGMIMMILAACLGAHSGAITEIFSWRFTKTSAPKIAKQLAGAIAGTIAAITVPLYYTKYYIELLPGDIGIVLWLILGMFVSVFAGLVVCDLMREEFTPRWAVTFSLLTMGLGMSLGMVLLWKLWLMLFPAIIIAVCLGKMISPTTKRSHLIKTYQKNILQLIKP